MENIDRGGRFSYPDKNVLGGIRLWKKSGDADTMGSRSRAEDNGWNDE